MTSDLADERFETGTDGGISEVGRRVEEEAQHHTCMFRAVAGWNLKFTTNCAWVVHNNGMRTQGDAQEEVHFPPKTGQNSYILLRCILRLRILMRDFYHSLSPISTHCVSS